MAEIWRCHDKVRSQALRGKALQKQALRGRVGVLWGRLVQATNEGGEHARRFGLHC